MDMCKIQLEHSMWKVKCGTSWGKWYPAGNVNLSHELFSAVSSPGIFVYTFISQSIVHNILKQIFSDFYSVHVVFDIKDSFFFFLIDI